MAKQITAAGIQEAIDEGIVEANKGYPRGYLGMSGIGDACPRKIWYQWRWAYIEKFNARMLRLFDRGHKEEYRITDWLRAAGFDVTDVDPETNRQYEFVACNEYVMGHSDGKVTLNIKNKKGKIKQKIDFVGEYKTSNKKGFMAMKRAKSVKVAKYVHYCQMQRYMHEQKLPQALYIMICKDDDAMYIEIVNYAPDTVAFLMEREKELVTTTRPPHRISEDETFWICSFCAFKPNCFHGEKAMASCRMCQHITLPGKGKWTCAKKKDNIKTLSLNEQLDGCKKFKEIIG